MKKLESKKKLLSHQCHIHMNTPHNTLNIIFSD